MADYKLPVITGTSLTTGDVLRWDGTDWVNYPDSNYNAPDYILITDEKTSGTASGTFTQDAWRLRDLNKEESDVGGHASVASNQITLAAGTYEYKISAPGFRVNQHKVRLYNSTDASVIAYGTSEYCEGTEAAIDVCTRSFVQGRFTIVDTKVLQVEHYCKKTYATHGFGARSSITGVVEIYTICEFWKVA